MDQTWESSIDWYRFLVLLDIPILFVSIAEMTLNMYYNAIPFDTVIKSSPILLPLYRVNCGNVGSRGNTTSYLNSIPIIGFGVASLFFSPWVDRRKCELENIGNTKSNAITFNSSNLN